MSPQKRLTLSSSEGLGPKPKKSKSTLKDSSKDPVSAQSLSVLSLYEDLSKPPARGPGGREACPLLDKVSIYTRRRSDNKLVYRCVGAASGCTKTYPVPRDKGRVLKHAGSCQYLSDTLQQAASSLLAEDAPSHRAESETRSSTKGPSTPTPFDATSTLSPSEPSIFSKAKAEGRRQLQAKLDLAIVNLFCVAGIPPHVADLPEWKEVWSIANSGYRPASKSKLENSHIPAEAAAVAKAQLKLLQEKTNLTISFDGGSLKSTHSNLTIHVITEDRHVYFFEGKDSTGFSHTGTYYYQALKNVCALLTRQTCI